MSPMFEVVRRGSLLRSMARSDAVFPDGAKGRSPVLVSYKEAVARSSPGAPTVVCAAHCRPRPFEVTISGPLQQATHPGLIAWQAPTPRAAGPSRVCRQGTRGGYFEGASLGVLGFRPSQKSQASPGWLQPRALGYSSPISLRCRRQSTALMVTVMPSLPVPSHEIVRNCGCGFSCFKPSSNQPTGAEPGRLGPSGFSNICLVAGSSFPARSSVGRPVRAGSRRPPSRSSSAPWSAGARRSRPHHLMQASRSLEPGSCSGRHGDHHRYQTAVKGAICWLFEFEIEPTVSPVRSVKPPIQCPRGANFPSSGQ
jgi:hypothetical protein